MPFMQKFACMLQIFCHIFLQIFWILLLILRQKLPDILRKNRRYKPAFLIGLE